MENSKLDKTINEKEEINSPKTEIKTREIPLYDPYTGQLNPYYEELTGKPNPLMTHSIK